MAIMVSASEMANLVHVARTIRQVQEANGVDINLANDLDKAIERLGEDLDQGASDWYRSKRGKGQVIRLFQDAFDAAIDFDEIPNKSLGYVLALQNAFNERVKAMDWED